MLNSIYQKFKLYFVSKTLQFSNSPFAYPFLFLICLAEAIIFPLPQEIIMIPMMAVTKARVYMIAFICLTGSLAGAVIAYFIGLFLFESIGILILETLHMNDTFYNFVSEIEQYGFLYVFIGGFTPLPFKVFTITSGIIGFNIVIFFFICLFTRGLRFFLVAYLTSLFGNKFGEFIEKKGALWFTIGGIVIVIVAAILYLLFK